MQLNLRRLGGDIEQTVFERGTLVFHFYILPMSDGISSVCIKFCCA